jgi:NAD(P)-dependent dehydrogenase (short-subunit alcohol dehydrogenase family)
MVSGGSLGLGRQLVLRLLGLGSRVTAMARGADALNLLRDEAGSHGDRLHIVPCDMIRAEEVERAVGQTVARHGVLDAVFHCVGRSMRGRVLQTPLPMFDELWRTNFLTAVHMARSSVAHLQARRGHFVAVGSLAGRSAGGLLGAYPASKAALALFMHQLRLEHGPAGLHTLLVLPGPIQRGDALTRYADHAPGLPETARLPGGAYI